SISKIEYAIQDILFLRSMMRMASTAALAVTVSWRFGSEFCGLTTVFGTSWLITPLKTLPNIRVSGLIQRSRSVSSPESWAPWLRDQASASYQQFVALSH